MEKVTLLLFLVLVSARSSFAQSISIRSDSQHLVDAFNWAKEKAMTFVVTGKEGPVDIYKKDQSSPAVNYIPSYWAGYPLRTAFYSRDFCHQVVGAHLLGLEEENFTMMTAFARSATASRKWFPLWAINFDGSPYKLDYRNDDDFVREIPAVFELVEKNLELFRWTGDRRYLTDEAITNFCGKAVDNFITLHDIGMINGVAESSGTGNIFVGTATYNEHADQTLIEAGDGIASQFKAFEAYAQLAQLKGDGKTAKVYRRKATALKKYFNSDWGVKDNEKLYNRGYGSAQEPIDGWGKENSWFLPLKEITDVKSPRHKRYLQFIDEQLSSVSGVPENIEAMTYIPELYFKYGQNETGWKWLNYIISKVDQVHSASHLTGNNGNYPEVSFVLIRNIVHDLAGISPGSSPDTIYTCSHLPEEVTFLGVDSLKVGESIVSILHRGTTESRLQHIAGNANKTWSASFPGKHAYLWLNGKQVKSKQRTRLGQVESYIDIVVKVGDEATVGISDIDKPALSAPDTNLTKRSH